MMMLNRAAWALSRLSSHGEMPGGVEIDIEDTHNFTVQARAVLLAIREPDDSVIDAGRDGVDFHDMVDVDRERANIRAAMTRMIDAILNEKPEA